MSDATKASMSINRENNKVKAKKIDDEVKALLDDQNARIKEIASEFNVKVDKVKGLMGNHTHYKKTRKPSLHNAKTHFKALQENASKIFHRQPKSCALICIYQSTRGSPRRT